MEIVVGPVSNEGPGIAPERRDERLYKVDHVSHGHPQIRRYWNCACTSGPRSAGVPEKIVR